MIILSNCLSEVVDEGCLKVANSLIKRIKKKAPETMVISYGESSQQGDISLSVNKLMLNRKLLGLLWKKKEPLLYIPAVAKAHTMAARVFILSLAARRGMQVVLVMQYQTGRLARMLLKASRAQLITLSQTSWQYYQSILGGQAYYLKTGVDTEVFHPVKESEKTALRKKYGLPLQKPIVLHVGHMRAGRNVGQLLTLGDSFHCVLVASTYAANDQDEELRRQLSEDPNITVMDAYYPNIEELYQLSDVYLFPVVAAHNCIDVPLSALEAASCNLPVVTTPYGELKELVNKEGFYEIKSFDPETMVNLIHRAYTEKKGARQSVLEYDWNRAVEKLVSQANEP